MWFLFMQKSEEAVTKLIFLNIVLHGNLHDFQYVWNVCKIWKFVSIDGLYKIITQEIKCF